MAIPIAFHGPSLDTWCMLGERPHIVTGYLRQWFAVHFSDEALTEEKHLRGLLWQEGDVTGIRVEDILRWKPETADQYPAILIARDEYQAKRLGINSEMMGHHDGKGDYFAENLEGRHVVLGLSTVPRESELLGCEILRELLQFGPRIRADLDLQRWEVSSLGKPFKVPGARHVWAVPVTVNIEMQVQWRLLRHAPFLKKMTLSDIF